MPPTASPLVSCWKNCSIVVLARSYAEPWAGPPLRARPPSFSLLLQYELPSLVHLVDPVQIPYPVSLGVEGDLPSQSRVILQLGLQIAPQLLRVGPLGLGDRLGHHQKPVSRQLRPDRRRLLVVLHLVRRQIRLRLRCIQVRWHWR